MTGVWVLLACLIPFALVGLLVRAGFRAGDRPGDGRVLGVGLVESGLLIAVSNPSGQPLIVGASLRPATWRFRVEGDLFVRVPRRTVHVELLPSNQDVLVVIEPRETATLLIPLKNPPKRSMQAVIAMGQQTRLRVVHRRVSFPNDFVANRRRSRLRFITDREAIFAEPSGGKRQR